MKNFITEESARPKCRAISQRKRLEEMSEPEGSARFDPQSEEWRQIWVDKENERKEKEDKKKELERKRVEREEMKQRKELEKNQNNDTNVKRNHPISPRVKA